MRGTDSILEVVLTVVEALEAIGVRHHLGGSFASTVHGVPRQTHDVDVVVELSSEQGARLVAVLGGGFYLSAAAVADAISRRSSFNAVHLGTGFKVDFFVAGGGEYDVLELERSIVEEIGGGTPRSVSVKSAEDTVLRKLEWFRKGGGVSERQWGDVLGVLKAQGDRLDREYLGRWADRLGVLDLLAAAVSEAERT